MPRFEETRYPHPTAFEGQENMLIKYRKFWMKIKNSKIFNAIRHSPLNPYHFGIRKIIADTPQQEQELARAKNLSQYIDKNGVRCTVNFDGSVNEEFEKTGKVMRGRGDVSHLIPRDKDGKLDLMAEEPILISVVPLEGISVTGHVCMQYKDRVINRVLHEINMEPLYPRYQNLSDYYLIYPSKVGIDSEKLIREMDRHNILCGDKKYNIATNNCAKNVAQVLEKAGVKDIDFLGPDKLKVRFPTPGNNPFHFGMEDWCLRHGVAARQDEISLLYKYHEIPNLDKRIEKFAAIRERYTKYRDKFLEKITQSKMAKIRKKTAQKIDVRLKTKLAERKMPIAVKRVEKAVSDKVFTEERQ